MMLTGNTKRGEYLIDKAATECEQYLRWYQSLSASDLTSYRYEYSVCLEILQNVMATYRSLKSPKEKEVEKTLYRYYELWQSKTGTDLFQSREGAEADM